MLPARAPRRVLAHLSGISNARALLVAPRRTPRRPALADEGFANRHLWVADVQSQRLERITATHTNETDPAASPTGGSIAYATDEVDFDLALFSPDGRSRQAVLSTARNEFGAGVVAGRRPIRLSHRPLGPSRDRSRSRDGLWERPIVTPDDFGTSPTDSMGALAFSPDGRDAGVSTQQRRRISAVAVAGNRWEADQAGRRTGVELRALPGFSIVVSGRSVDRIQ